MGRRSSTKANKTSKRERIQSAPPTNPPIHPEEEASACPINGEHDDPGLGDRGTQDNPLPKLVYGHRAKMERLISNPSYANRGTQTNPPSQPSYNNRGTQASPLSKPGYVDTGVQTNHAPDDADKGVHLDEAYPRPPAQPGLFGTVTGRVLLFAFGLAVLCILSLPRPQIAQALTADWSHYNNIGSLSADLYPARQTLQEAKRLWKTAGREMTASDLPGGEVIAEIQFNLSDTCGQLDANFHALFYDLEELLCAVGGLTEDLAHRMDPRAETSYSKIYGLLKQVLRPRPGAQTIHSYLDAVQERLEAPLGKAVDCSKQLDTIHELDQLASHAHQQHILPSDLDGVDVVRRLFTWNWDPTLLSHASTQRAVIYSYREVLVGKWRGSVESLIHSLQAMVDFNRMARSHIAIHGIPRLTTGQVHTLSEHGLQLQALGRLVASFVGSSDRSMHH